MEEKMSRQETQNNTAQEANVDVSFLGLGTIGSWILFSAAVVGGIILLPYLINKFL